MRRPAGMRQVSNSIRASGCGAIASMRSATVNPRSAGSTTKALMPSAETLPSLRGLPGEVRANTQ